MSGVEVSGALVQVLKHIGYSFLCCKICNMHNVYDQNKQNIANWRLVNVKWRQKLSLQQ